VDATVRDSAGVIVAEALRLPPIDAPGFTWRLDTIQSFEASGRLPDGEPLLYEPRRFATLSDGTLVVLDGGPRPLSVLRPDGTASRLASWGQGPGEIQDGYARVAPAGADAFDVHDMSNRRVTRFDTAGNLVFERALDLGGATFQWLEVTPAGEAYAHLWYRDLHGSTSATLGDSVRRVFPPWEDDRRGVPMPDREVARASNARTVLFDSRLVFAALGTGDLVVSRNDSGEFRHFGADGRLRTIVRLPLHPREIDPLEHRDILSEFARVAGASARGVSVDIDSHYPIYTLLRPLGDSVFVLEHSVRGSPEGDAPLRATQRSWRLVSVTGEYLGGLALPDGFMPALTLAFEVIGVTTTEEGRQWVNRFEVVAPDPAGAR
jgi:hypothetical protein